MMSLVQTLMTIAIGVIAPAGGDHHAVCPSEPSVCGYVEGATRYYLHGNSGPLRVVVHDDAVAAAQYIAGVTGIAYE